MSKSLKKLLILLIVVIVWSAVMTFSAHQTHGIVGIPFGGLVTSSHYCTCSDDFVVTVGPPLGGIFAYFPGTPQFPYSQLPRPGVWVLGLYEPVGVCLQFAGTAGCVPDPLTPIGTITPIVGTSL